MSDVTEWLKERRTIHNAAAVGDVLELHHGERDEYGCWTCRFCSHIQQAKILYPCATVRAIEGASK